MTRPAYYVDLKDAILAASDRGAELEVYDVLAEEVVLAWNGTRPETGALWPIKSSTILAIHGPKIDLRVTVGVTPYPNPPAYGMRVERVRDMRALEDLSTREAVNRLEELTA